MEWAGRVGRDELDVEMERLLLGHSAEGISRLTSLIEHALQPRGGEAHVDEAGRCHLDFGQDRTGGNGAQTLGQHLGDLQW